jgi:tetratricopeptide (TPR) repeat protein
MSGRRDVFDQAMRQGHSAAWDQQWDRAIAAYRKAVEEFPSDGGALSSLGLALLESRQTEAALIVYERAARLSPEDPVPLEKTAEILERLGRLEEAAPRYMRAADLHLTRRDVEKAIDNWARAARLSPDLLLAHQRLALAYERLGKRGPAISAYLTCARLLQAAGDIDRAMEAAERARTLEPRNADVLRAIDLLNRGVPLPRIKRPGGVTDALRAVRSAFPSPDAQAARAATVEAPGRDEAPEASDPGAASRERALAALAAYLFDTAADEDRPVGQADGDHREWNLFGSRKPSRAGMIAALAQAIDAQKRGDAPAAIAAFEQAVEQGLEHPAARLCLGLLYLDAADSRQRAAAAGHLRAAAASPDFRAGANFGLARLYRADGKMRDALRPLMEVLRDVDLETVPADRQDELSQIYESLIEEMARTDDDVQHASVVANLLSFLSGAGWSQRVRAARRQLDATAADDGGALAPLAEILSIPGTERVIESMRLIDLYYDRGQLFSAMDEAYHAIENAPTYLPIHLRMADILLQENRLEDALAKYVAVAETYEVRGDPQRASRILEKVVRLAPIDPGARNRLIQLLVSQGRIDEALSQHLDLAEAYYRQADLNGARQTFTNALRLAQRSSGERAWSVQILHAMGDIDMQRLDLRQATRVYQQIKTLAPADEKARLLLVDLNYRLGQAAQALNEADDYLRFCIQQGAFEGAIAFLEELVRQRPDEPGLRTRLAHLYQERGRMADAIAQLDALGSMQLRAGQQAKAAETVRAILAMQPDTTDSYRQLLAQLEASN